MNSFDIISQLAKDKTVEELVTNISKKKLTDSHLDDLSQDIYIALMEKPPELVEELFNKGELHYYIARMVVNNLHSNLSPYYYKYIKPEIHEDIEDIKNT